MTDQIAPRRAATARPTKVVIVGGGYVGMYTALRLQRSVSRGQAEITVIDPQANMTYQPFLPEAAAGSVEPRHVVVSLRRVLRKCRIVAASVTGIDHGHRTVTVQPEMGDAYLIDYDLVVVCPGSISRLMPIPGLGDFGIGFKTIGEAIYLRNRVLAQIDFAASTDNAELRKRALTFVFVGGGYAGVEAMAELEDMAAYYVRRYVPGMESKEMRWVLVEAATRIMPEVSVPLGSYTVDRLTERGIDVRLETRLESAVGGHIELSDGEKFDANTLVWTAGVKANPMLENTDLPRDDKGRVPTAASMAVRGVSGVFAAGDCAAVPDLTGPPGAICGPSAQHAVRQAKVLAKNLKREITGNELLEYRHKYVGSVASLGLYRGVAEIHGIKLKGIVAWFMHRTYHVSRMPTLNRKVRVLADWTGALVFRREVVSLGQLQQPLTVFQEAAVPSGNAAAAMPPGSSPVEPGHDQPESTEAPSAAAPR
ncbi:MAG: NAD(P)/FAD-dependent oxidoreductase [Jatrophihabitans sp.]